MKRNVLIGVILLAIVLVIVIVGAIIRNRKGSSAGVPYTTAKVERGNIEIAVSATGTVEPISSVDVKSKASGEIIAVPVEAGERIKKGALIAKVDPTDVKNAYDQVKADLDVAVVARKQAELDLKRQQGLYDKGLSSDKDLEDAQMVAEKARAAEVKARVALILAAKQLNDTVLRSPMDGVVLVKNVNTGQIIASGISAVSGGTTIATIADLSRVYVRSNVDETDIGKAAVGQKVRIKPDAYPDSVLSGKVEAIAPQSTTVQNVTTFQITCTVENKNGLLFSGMNVSTEIVAAERDDVLTVPLAAVKDFSELMTLGPQLGLQPPRRPEGGAAELRAPIGGPEGFGNPGGPGGKVAFVMNNGKVEPRRVEVGLKNLDRCEIKSGLAEGEEVLVFRSTGSKSGDKFGQRMPQMGIPGLKKQ
jgi:HlyD family secretion protein